MNGPGSRRDPPPAWSTPWELFVLIGRGHTLRTGALVAAVVGTVLSAVNEGSTIAVGHVDAGTWIRVGSNYVIPFVVASIGYLAPFRERFRRDDSG